MNIRELLDQRDLVVAAGVWDGWSSIIAREAGYEALFIAGFAVAASQGVPDADLYSKSDMLRATHLAHINTGLPIVADMDTGWGNEVGVYHAIAEFERAGASAIFIEDQQPPKRCPLSVHGELPLLSMGEAQAKIDAAVQGRKSPATVVIARTDADGDEIVRRAKAYVEAGADMVLPVAKNASFNLDRLAALHREIKVPLVISLTPTNWVEREVTPDAARRAGIRLLFHPLQGLYAATSGMLTAYRAMLAGTPVDEVSRGLAVHHDEFVSLIGFPKVEALEERFRHWRE
jgi:methylisocitrate lyase